MDHLSLEELRCLSLNRHEGWSGPLPSLIASKTRAERKGFRKSTVGYSFTTGADRTRQGKHTKSMVRDSLEDLLRGRHPWLSQRHDGDGPMVIVLLGLLTLLLFILVLATPIGRALVGQAFLVGWLVLVVGFVLLLAVYLKSE